MYSIIIYKRGVLCSINFHQSNPVLNNLILDERVAAMIEYNYICEEWL